MVPRFISWAMALTMAAAWGQVSPPPGLMFEVSEVKIGYSGPGHPPTQTLLRDGTVRNAQWKDDTIYISSSPVFAPSGQLRLSWLTMRELITLAYKEILSDDFLTGGPKWLNSDHFDIVAKAPEGTFEDTQKVMLQTLLAERFHLSLRRDQKLLEVFVLSAGKQVKLKPSAGPGPPTCKRVPLPIQPSAPQIHDACTNMSMAELANRLPSMASQYVDRVVIDRTGLSGPYDFQLDWLPIAGMAVGSNSESSLFEALARLGLKLEQRKEPLPVIVVDHVDRVPTEN
jgi:uncharacterized protein (TIGR03435 family)